MWTAEEGDRTCFVTGPARGSMDDMRLAPPVTDM